MDEIKQQEQKRPVEQKQQKPDDPMVSMVVTSFRVGSVKNVAVGRKMYRITNIGDGDKIPLSIAEKIEKMEVEVSTPQGRVKIKPYRIKY